MSVVETASRSPSAKLCRCEGCGREFTVSGRGKRARWHSDACRKAATRAANRSRWPDLLEQGEEALVSLIRSGRRQPEDALLLIVEAWPKAAEHARLMALARQLASRPLPPRRRRST